jgi:hypothetical protein
MVDAQQQPTAEARCSWKENKETISRATPDEVLMA